MQFALSAKREHRVSVSEAARRLTIAKATLKGWLDGWEKNALALEARGRPTRNSNLEQRREVYTVLDLCGPEVGVPTLQLLFDSMPRRELEDMVRKFRKACFEGKRVSVNVLTWSHPGAVWAMDYTAPPSPVEGRYRTILVVRDLASGRTLLALPADEDSAQTTVDALSALFVEHGAPLVMKSDNGRHFTADEVIALLAEHGVVHLRSPNYTPSYNGGCEAGIGAVKTRAHHEAARHDRPGEWTCDDVEAARLRGNELGYPHGRARGTPDQAWATRVTITPELRDRFASSICQNRLAELEARGYQEGAPLDEDVELSIRRAAIGLALSQQGFVQYRRRLVSLPITPGLRSRIA